MSDGYDENLARLKRAAARQAAHSKVVQFACSVCSAKPAPMTRFGPRCERHRPAPELP